MPNGPADVATFGLSDTTDVSISANTEVNSVIFTSAATNPYTIFVTDVTLTISGVGITNNSGVRQTFHVGGGFFARGFGDQTGEMNFTNSASAGNATIELGSVASMSFFNRSSAASATLSGGNGSSWNFFDNSTAGNASMFDAFGLHESVTFHDNSTAGSATLDPGEESDISLFDQSSAGNATIFGGFHGLIDFFDSSTAGSATIQGFASLISFHGLSKGGTAAIELFFGVEVGSWLDISGHNAPGVTIGSLQDDGTATARVFLGANNLTVGSNNLSTTFSGVIRDGGEGGGTGGSLTKIGTGTLILSGVNTYTGDTNVNRGVLQVDGSIASNTFVNHSGTVAGIGTVKANVTNNDFGIVRPGGALGAAGMLTVTGNYTQTQYATLMIQIAGASPDQLSVLNVLGNATLSGFLDPVLLNGFVPTIGDSFVFLNYASLNGEFSHIKHRVFDNGMLQWSVMYEANHAILTVEQHVSDKGSTLLLLTLGLFGLVTYERQLLRAELRSRGV